MIFYNKPIDRIYQYLLIASFFLLPLTVVGNNIAIWLIIIFWSLSGDYARKFHEINKNNLALISSVFFVIHIVALIWTENIPWGIEMSRKMLPFLFVLPVLLTLSRRENIRYYCGAFLLAMLISVFFSFLVWFEIIAPFKNATVGNPTPFTSHISYNPFLAFAFYLVLEKLLFGKPLTQLMRSIYIIFAIAIVIDIFITGGRAGQVMFFLSLIILALQYFKQSKLKALSFSFLLIFSVVFIAYSSSLIFKTRLDAISDDIKSFEVNKNTPVGLRINFALNTFELIKISPIFGIGTGDFPDEYKKINQIKSPEAHITIQPHNMYLLLFAQFGVLVLTVFLWIFLIQYKLAL